MIKRLKECRNDKGLSQKEIAKLLNITQQTYSDYETGRTNPDIDTLLSIAAILGCTTDYLLGRTDDFGNVSVQSLSSETTTSERQVLNEFRALTETDQNLVKEYIKFLNQKNKTK